MLYLLRPEYLLCIVCQMFNGSLTLLQCLLFMCFFLFGSCGPQKCSACIKEDLFEEPTSILKQGGVSTFSYSSTLLAFLAVFLIEFGLVWNFYKAL